MVGRGLNTCFKYTIKWFLVYSLNCATITTIEFWAPVNSHPSLLPVSPCQLLVYLLWLWTFLFGMFHISMDLSVTGQVHVCFLKYLHSPCGSNICL